MILAGWMTLKLTNGRSKEDHTDEPEQQLSRSLSRLETQDIKTQPQFNHYLDSFSCWGCVIPFLCWIWNERASASELAAAAFILLVLCFAAAVMLSPRIDLRRTAGSPNLTPTNTRSRREQTSGRHYRNSRDFNRPETQSRAVSRG